VTDQRLRLTQRLARLQGGLIAALIVGATVAFGGDAWWVRPVLGAGLALLAVAGLARATLERDWRVMVSPLAPIAMLTIALAVIQLVPLPPSLTSRLSPQARAAHVFGALPSAVAADDPDEARAQPDPGPARVPVSLDRAATLRWAVGAIGGLFLFVAVAYYADRLDRARLVWGSVVAALYLTTALALIQWVGGTDALLVILREPGRGPSWAPSLVDLASESGRGELRPLLEPDGRTSPWSYYRMDRPAPAGAFVAGRSALIALGALGLPLALGLGLHSLASRGSRERLRDRLAEPGRNGLMVLVLVLTPLAAGTCGYAAGWGLAAPLALGLVVAGLPGAWSSGLRWTAVGLTALTLVAASVGAALGDPLGHPEGPGVPVTVADWREARELARDAIDVARDFPAMGVGLGGFPSVQAYYKHRDTTTANAAPAVLRWWAEAGLAGIALAGLAAIWGLARLPIMLRRVGSADRVLAFALTGSLLAFAVTSLVQPTLQAAAVALAACAVAGTAERWLAGGTDLFAESL
jgi:hypothetical protein